LTAAAWIVVAWPGVSLGSAEVYARYRPAAGAQERVRQLAAPLCASGGVEQLAALVENDLGSAAEELCPPIAALRERFLAQGAAAASVRGSGAAGFGLVRR